MAKNTRHPTPPPVPNVNDAPLQLHNRRYIGSKHKLSDWIFSIISRECRGDTFTDLFAGTGTISAVARTRYKHLVLNDFLYSNYAIYQAFFSNQPWDQAKVMQLLDAYNRLRPESLPENYFSTNFGGKFFSHNSARLIGHVRDLLETHKSSLTPHEFYLLLTSLLYTADKIANTVGHYDAYFKKAVLSDAFHLRPITPLPTDSVTIYREDANLLAKRLVSDIVYIDPPYNSRQYSRFYHVLETLTKWDKPQLFGTALKPAPENMSDYCRNSAKDKFSELIHDLKAKYLVVSYNNTYASKSSSSKNKITLEEIEAILQKKGRTKVYTKDYRHFNAGNTNFINHKEYLFVTKVTA